MPEFVGYLEWRSQNRTTTYPFIERATFTTVAGKTLPEGVLVDASLYPLGEHAGLHLSKVVVTDETTTLYVGTEAATDLLKGSFTNSQPPNTLKLYDTYNRDGGLLVSENGGLGLFRLLGLGEHIFRLSATEFCASVCSIMPVTGVNGILLPDGTVLSGQIFLVGEDGVVLKHGTTTVYPACGTPYEVEVITAHVVGDPLFRKRLCSTREDYVGKHPITQVRVSANGQMATMSLKGFGDFVVEATNSAHAKSALRVITSADGVDLSIVGD